MQVSSSDSDFDCPTDDDGRYINFEAEGSLEGNEEPMNVSISVQKYKFSDRDLSVEHEIVNVEAAPQGLQMLRERMLV